MKGRHHIVVQNNRIRYELDIKRNITIIRGDSATGKTTLIMMLEQYANLGSDSGIDVLCDKEIQVLAGKNWQSLLDNLDDHIVFIDEESAFIKTEEFAAAVRGSSCYFVLITREDLPNLPYSVEEIYGIHASGRYRNTKRVFNEMYQIYTADLNAVISKPETVIVEDSNAGFDFFNHFSEAHGLSCESAKGKSNLAKTVKDSGFLNMLVVGDGAAIGPEMNRLFSLMQSNRNLRCYFPESFEWIILKSGLIDGNKVKKILEEPENYIESAEYFSWERFFTKTLIDFTEGTYQKYSKAKLNSYYTQDKEIKQIRAVMPDLGI
jgi:hypothetical protein